MSSSDFREANVEGVPGAAGGGHFAGLPHGSHVSADPILDLAEFQLLEDQLDNPRIARDFARDFVRLWEARHQTLRTAVEHGDVPAALDAILSLRTSSAMVGGVRLAGLAGQMEEHINNGDLGQARPLLHELAECGESTIQELKESYVLKNSTPEPDPTG
ncbi:Hpt domain-containing protein [Paenarthrobacter sp. NCHU4564]|uniref:Hpt domain-containing protein n=1 Tax=Paenarthrobacter sp. NCHU4564 TaxID=3451353 RepID=UPI003F9CD0B0